MMDERLLTLIHEWEAEIDRLHQLIDEAIADHEYLSAHYHHEAIQLCYQSIYQLARLAGDRYSEIYHTLSHIEHLKSIVKNASTAHDRNFTLRYLQRKEDELFKLASLARYSKKPESSDTIQKQLERLALKKINGFNLILDRMQGVLIKVRALDQGFVLSIPRKAFLSKYNYDIDGDAYLDEYIQRVCSLGFVSSEDLSEFILEVKKSKKEAIRHTMTCLSILCLEVLNDFIKDKIPTELEIV